jgi:hypothetical protein
LADCRERGERSWCAVTPTPPALHASKQSEARLDRPIARPMTGRHDVGCNFVDYADRLGLHHVTTAAAVAWARQPVDRSPAWWKTRLSVVRGFARHLHPLDPAHEVPASDVLAARAVGIRPSPDPDASFLVAWTMNTAGRILARPDGVPTDHWESALNDLLASRRGAKAPRSRTVSVLIAHRMQQKC